MKKILIPIVVVAVILVLAVVFLKSEKNIEGTLDELMTKVYAEIAEDELPMMLTNIEVTGENAEMFLGTADIDFKEALASESAVGSIAHSVVLVRLNDAKDAKEAVEQIKEKVDPRKWICVEASNVIVKSKGDLVILIMSNETLASKLDANFEGLE